MDTVFNNDDVDDCNKWVFSDYSVIEEFLKNFKEAVHNSDDDNRTPLHLAVDNGLVDIARLIIDHGADVNVRTIELGMAPLHMAVRYDSIDMVKLLLDNGADINIRNKIDHCPLHIAIGRYNMEMVKLLLSKRANPNVSTRDRRMETPLLKAATISLELTKLLVDSGAQLRNGLKEILVSLLANKPDIANYLLDVAIANNDTAQDDELKLELRPNRIGKTHFRALCSHVMSCEPQLAVEIMTKLIKLNGNVNENNPYGPLLHNLIVRGEQDEVAVELFNEFLSIESTNCNIKAPSLGTPLCYAMERRQFMFANQLIVKGFADVSNDALKHFTFTPESVDTLKLLYFNGLKFPHDFQEKYRPFNSEGHEVAFAEFCSWLQYETNNVMNLKNLIRISLRKTFGKLLSKFISDSSPKYIYNFLMFE